jgi:hypothetical protein
MKRRYAMFDTTPPQSVSKNITCTSVRIRGSLTAVTINNHSEKLFKAMPIVGKGDAWSKDESIKDRTHTTDVIYANLLGRATPAQLELRVELDRSLEMFFSKLGHAEVLQPEADHPMVKRIGRSELVSLVFVSGRFLESSQRSLGACELIVGQGKLRIALHRVAPNRNGFLLATKLPERFAFFLTSEN